jgi:hypothetical protein
MLSLAEGMGVKKSSVHVFHWGILSEDGEYAGD